MSLLSSPLFFPLPFSSLCPFLPPLLLFFFFPPLLDSNQGWGSRSRKKGEGGNEGERRKWGRVGGWYSGERGEESLGEKCDGEEKKRGKEKEKKKVKVQEKEEEKRKGEKEKEEERQKGEGKNKQEQDETQKKENQKKKKEKGKEKKEKEKVPSWPFLPVIGQHFFDQQFFENLFSKKKLSQRRGPLEGKKRDRKGN